MEEAEIHEKQVSVVQSEITQLLLGLETSANRDADLEACEDKLGTAKHALEALRVSLGELKGAERDAVRKKCVAMEKVHQQQEKEIEYQKSMGVRNVLLDGASSAAVNGPADPKTSEEAYAMGRSLMDEDKQGLERIQGMIANSRDVGLKTGQALVRQNDQLRKVASDLGEVDSMLDRTGVLMRRMLRKAGTDKYLWCLIFLVVVMIITVAAYAAVHGTGSDSSTTLPSTTTP